MFCKRLTFFILKEIEQEKCELMYHHYIENDELEAAVQRLFDIIVLHCQRI